MNHYPVLPEAVGFSSARLARIKPFMQSYIDDQRYAGVSTLLALRGRVVHCEYVGFQDRESKTALTDGTIFLLPQYSVEPVKMSSYQNKRAIIRHMS